MDQSTQTALTQIVEAQTAVLRALQIIATIPPEHVQGGVLPLIEVSVTHLEEAMKAINRG